MCHGNLVYTQQDTKGMLKEHAGAFSRLFFEGVSTNQLLSTEMD
jgi:hypothetical protein